MIALLATTIGKFFSSSLLSMAELLLEQSNISNVFENGKKDGSMTRFLMAVLVVALATATTGCATCDSCQDHSPVAFGDCCDDLPVGKRAGSILSGNSSVDTAGEAESVPGEVIDDPVQ